MERIHREADTGVCTRHKESYCREFAVFLKKSSILAGAAVMTEQEVTVFTGHTGIIMTS